jgi:fluoride exporter
MRERASLEQLTSLLAIGVGGFLGANARYLTSEWTATRLEAWFGLSHHWGTFLVNASGSFLLAFLAVWLTERLPVSSALRLMLLVGFLGAYTTYSTFASESLHLLRTAPADGVIYLVTTNVVCLLAALAGFTLAWQVGAR